MALASTASALPLAQSSVNVLSDGCAITNYAHHVDGYLSVFRVTTRQPKAWQSGKGRSLWDAEALDWATSQLTSSADKSVTSCVISNSGTNVEVFAKSVELHD
jgi:hypothetical protein